MRCSGISSIRRSLGQTRVLPSMKPIAGQAIIYVACHRHRRIAELYYLNEKKGRPLDFAAKYALLAQSKQFVLLRLYPSHVLDFDASAAIAEMHDRIIVGAARRMNAKLLTRDRQIRKNGLITTVWQCSGWPLFAEL